MDYLPFSSKNTRNMACKKMKYILFFFDYRATRGTDLHFLNFRNKARGRNGAFFKFQYTDKGVMGQGVRFIDFYHYLCHQ